MRNILKAEDKRRSTPGFIWKCNYKNAGGHKQQCILVPFFVSDKGLTATQLDTLANSVIHTALRTNLVTYLLQTAESFLRTYPLSASQKIPRIFWKPKVH